MTSSWADHLADELGEAAEMIGGWNWPTRPRRGFWRRPPECSGARRRLSTPKNAK